MTREKIKIGVASTRRTVFSTQEALRNKGIILDKLKEYDVEVVDIEDINEEGLVHEFCDVEKTIDKFKKANVHGVFLPHCNFGSEDLVAKIAKAIEKPVLLWGPRDDAPLDDGFRTRDTQCGLFATGKVLRRFNVPYTYIVNSHIDDEVFRRGFETFIAVCSVVDAFKKIKILQIAPRPTSFWSMICNEGELLETFGIEVMPITLQDIVNDMDVILEQKNEVFRKNMEKIRTQIDCSQITEQDLQKIIALKTAILQYCEREKCTAVAIQCWNAMQDVLGIMPCITNGLLFDEFIPTTCETDLHGAVSAIILQEAAMRTSAVFFADLTVRHPTNDNAELLWHCGNFPISLAKNDSSPEIGRHFIFDGHCPGTGEWQLKDGDITICRFDGDHGKYTLLVCEGKSVPGPSTKGTYVWFEVENWPKLEEKLVTGPYVHHCAGIYGKVAPILYEACKYIPGLDVDLAEPSVSEVRNWLRGTE